jgi:hypothetical protein
MNQTDGIVILYSMILIIVRLALRQKFRRTGHVVRMKEMRNENKNSVEKMRSEETVLRALYMLTRI